MSDVDREVFGKSFEAWVYEPGRSVYYHGFPTADAWIGDGRVIVTARTFRYWRPQPHSFTQFEYRWPTAVVEVQKPVGWAFRAGTLLVDINGKLGSVVLRSRLLKGALREAGFSLIETSGWTWTNAPFPVSRSVLGPHANEVPTCVVQS